ncbi:MAG: hypothetical protein WB729_06755 [Candidatus Sulfotelmatobacter sp.]
MTIAPSAESLVRLLFAIGGVVAGVASTVAGSWISSKIHVYHENRKAHLEEIKEIVLNPISHALAGDFARLVEHKASAVLLVWGTRSRKQIASVTESQTDEGHSLAPALPDISATTNSVLYADAKKKHFPKLVDQVEHFIEAWRTHATDCHAWVVHLSEEILKNSQMEPFPTSKYGNTYVDHRKLGLFIYRRLFRCTQHSLQKHFSNPLAREYWILEGFEGTSAAGTEQQLTALISVLDDLVIKEKDNADRLQADARVLEQSLTSLRSELNYAVAHRHLKSRCDLVPFF